MRMMFRWLAVWCPLVVVGSVRSAETAPFGFALEEGDRVVLLGGTMIEREQNYGEWEVMLTCLYADVDFTMRNLGWSADTVWADSRGIFDPPQKGYERMIEQIAELNPTVVVLGYGANEAWAGADGLDAFLAQYQKLLDDIQQATEAETRYLLILPIGHFQTSPDLPDPTAYNVEVDRYAAAIADLAAQRRIPVLAPYPRPILEELRRNPEALAKSVDAGIHFNLEGYRGTAWWLRRQLSGAMSAVEEPYLLRGELPVATGFEVREAAELPAGTRVAFHVRRHDLASDYMTVGFPGLPPGRYTLRIDGEEVITASAAEWESLQLDAGPDARQREELRQAILRKNELYFHRWRPQNVTYLFGFRSYEQGNNAVEIPQFDPLVADMETRIRELKQPVERVWELVPAEG